MNRRAPWIILPAPRYGETTAWGPVRGWTFPLSCYVGAVSPEDVPGWITPMPSYVGATSAEDARDVIRLIDEIAIYFPVTSAALALQATIFKWADLFGVKDQVEYAVYALRASAGADYGAVGAGIVPIGGVTSASVSTALSGAGALGAVLPIAGAAVAVVAFLSGGDEDVQKERLKRAQADIQHLRDRLTLTQFASEQRVAADNARFNATAPLLSSMLSPEDVARLQGEAQTADKLASLYDKAQADLPADQKAIFESLSNLGRWRAILQSYSEMSTKQRDDFDSIGFGTKGYRLPTQLKPKVAAEQHALSAASSGGPATGASSGGPATGAGSFIKGALVLGALTAAVLGVTQPALVRSYAGKALGGARSLYRRFT